jgi:hypothetical protein
MQLNISKSWVGLALTGFVALSACSDSELHGLEPDHDASHDTQDATAVTDATVTPDSTDTTVPTDVRPDTSDAGCTSNESCRGVLGELGPCRAPICDLATGQCRAVDTCVACRGDGDCKDGAPVCNDARSTREATCAPHAPHLAPDPPRVTTPIHAPRRRGSRHLQLPRVGGGGARPGADHVLAAARVQFRST